MCANHPIHQKAVAALPATPHPDLPPIETAVPATPEVLVDAAKSIAAEIDPDNTAGYKINSFYGLNGLSFLVMDATSPCPDPATALEVLWKVAEPITRALDLGSPYITVDHCMGYWMAGCHFTKPLVNVLEAYP